MNADDCDASLNNDVASTDLTIGQCLAKYIAFLPQARIATVTGVAISLEPQPQCMDIIYEPTQDPTMEPTLDPTTANPTSPTMKLTIEPTENTYEPTQSPTKDPTASPVNEDINPDDASFINLNTNYIFVIFILYKSYQKIKVYTLINHSFSLHWIFFSRLFYLFKPFNYTQHLYILCQNRVH